MTNIKLSIIIPIHNKAEYIEYCLKSVLGQTLADCEIICIDDGSTDKSKQIINFYAKRNSCVKLLTQNNQGAGAARNAGIKAAEGEYIAFMDADDYYPSNDILSRLYYTAVANNALICGGSFMTDDCGTVVDKFDGDMAGNTFEKEGWVNFSEYQFDYSFYRFIYNREFLIKNNLFFPNHRRYQDPPFMLRAFSAAGKFYAIPDITYCYRIGPNHVDWTVEKVYDLLCGIEDNLKFSSQNGYEKVHRLNYSRLCKNFCGNIINTALQADSEGKILRKLIEVQASVNWQMLSGSDEFENVLCYSKPLDELIRKLSEQNIKIKSEGWFINKKLFRFYTWPLRVIGKALKAKKRK